MRARSCAHASELPDDILRNDRPHLGTWFRQQVRVHSKTSIYAAARLTLFIAAECRRESLISSQVYGVAAAEEADDRAFERAGDVHRT